LNALDSFFVLVKPKVRVLLEWSFQVEGLQATPDEIEITELEEKYPSSNKLSYEL